MKAMLKSELARAAGVSLDTMRKYINAVVPNNPIFKDYNINAKMLTPKQAQFVCDYYAIIFE